MTEWAVKRYVVFSGDTYYPGGGWSDFRSSHDTLAEARSAAKPGDWSMIIDLKTGQVMPEES